MRRKLRSASSIPAAVQRRAISPPAAAIRVAADGESMFAPSVTRRLIEEFAQILSQGAPAGNSSAM